MKNENFVLTLENNESPIIITVPHGGMPNRYASWLDPFFQKRIKSDNPSENLITGEKIVVGSDGQIMHIVADILKEYPANAIIGLLPRSFVDYNRFVPEVAYTDQKIKPFYGAYHNAIIETIERLKKNKKIIFLFDFHGFGKQPIDGMEFDVIIGTDGKTSPLKTDKFLYDYFGDKYKVFCAGMKGLPKNESESYRGNTTNLWYYLKYKNILDSMLIEISPKFRSSKGENSKENGIQIARDFASYFKKVDEEAGLMEEDIEANDMFYHSLWSYHKNIFGEKISSEI
ncbi:MAG: hypothetical protein WCT42_02175 [Candidatus Paceibacterota bacterium]